MSEKKTQPYTLYGSYASYYTAKVRSYLRKKGIPFVERLPSDPLFRNKVRPSSGTHRIPQLLTPQGEVIQDSVAIVDALEPLFPEMPAFPTTPRQRVFVHLMELLGSEGLVRMAWLHRWMFEENFAFVKRDFGRSFKPGGDDAELLKYGNVIADRMMSYGLPESTPQAREALDQQYVAFLRLFEAHLQHHPYLLGGQPTVADYAVMGALHAHLGRDPAGLRMMQDNAVRTFRWVENMLVPEVVSPEFHATPVALVGNDEVPQTALVILEFIGQNFGEGFVRGAHAFDQAMQRLQPDPGYELAPEDDQPILPVERIERHGAEVEHATQLYGVWVTQRAQRFYHTLDGTERALVDACFADRCLSELLHAPFTYELARRSNRLVISASYA